jgi:hypothetical protein
MRSATSGAAGRRLDAHADRAPAVGAPAQGDRLGGRPRRTIEGSVAASSGARASPAIAVALTPPPSRLAPVRSGRLGKADGHDCSGSSPQLSTTLQLDRMQGAGQEPSGAAQRWSKSIVPRRVPPRRALYLLGHQGSEVHDGRVPARARRVRGYRQAPGSVARLGPSWVSRMSDSGKRRSELKVIALLEIPLIISST